MVEVQGLSFHGFDAIAVETIFMTTEDKYIFWTFLTDSVHQSQGTVVIWDIRRLCLRGGSESELPLSGKY